MASYKDSFTSPPPHVITINSYRSWWKVLKQSNYNYLVCEEVNILRKAEQMGGGAVKGGKEKKRKNC
jgi:hypothetical protein